MNYTFSFITGLIVCSLNDMLPVFDGGIKWLALWKLEEHLLNNVCSTSNLSDIFKGSSKALLVCPLGLESLVLWSFSKERTWSSILPHCAEYPIGLVADSLFRKTALRFVGRTCKGVHEALAGPLFEYCFDDCIKKKARTKRLKAGGR